LSISGIPTSPTLLSFSPALVLFYPSGIPGKLERTARQQHHEFVEHRMWMQSSGNPGSFPHYATHRRYRAGRCWSATVGMRTRGHKGATKTLPYRSVPHATCGTVPQISLTALWKFETIQRLAAGFHSPNFSHHASSNFICHPRPHLPSLIFPHSACLLSFLEFHL